MAPLKLQRTSYPAVAEFWHGHAETMEGDRERLEVVSGIDLEHRAHGRIEEMELEQVTRELTLSAP
ncbi:hypothetical protein [Nocardioides sp. B-3]|uniref:hypothetical protein n=1 Tax=Nocardioides sp. B-3 TaxID=2895565 RepID=UPI002153A0C4|nr:hypothetical protein [Nocardioides sp. B-3]UUZ59484.1 hypothetical protein LP418_27535 [Nocardioides sp. B-3]